jgi:DNA-binding response OmpR family regulator
LNEQQKINCNYNVLLVEDDEDSAHIMVAELAEAGFGVRWTNSRDEALLILDRYLYDIIVLDYLMPGLDADSFVKIVKSDYPLSRVVLISVVHNIKDVAGKLGVSCWLAKPFYPTRLSDYIAKC